MPDRIASARERSERSSGAALRRVQTWAAREAGPASPGLAAALALAVAVAAGAPAPVQGRDIFVIGRSDPDVTPVEIASELERRGVPRGVLADVSPPGSRDSRRWGRITFDYRGKAGARIHLLRMSRPPFLQQATGPALQPTLDSARCWYGFLGPVPDTGAAIALKVHVAAALARRSAGLVYDGNLGRLVAADAWQKLLEGEDFEFPLAVERAVLRCSSVPATPVETVSFGFIPTSLGAVAFDLRNVTAMVTADQLPPGSVEAGVLTTHGVAFRVLDIERQWGSGRPAVPARRYVLLEFERGGLMVAADAMRGPVEVQELGVEVLAASAAPGGLARLVIESGESRPAGMPAHFLWLGPGTGTRDTPAQVDPLEVVRPLLRGGPPGRRENALRALCRAAGPDALALLRVTARSGPGERARQIALRGLASRPDGPYVLLDMARTGRGREGAEAVQALAAVKGLDVRRTLLSLASSEIAGIDARQQALLSLRGRVTPADLAPLQPLLACREPVVAVLAADLILRLGPSLPARQALVDALAAGAPDDDDVVLPTINRHRVVEAVPVLLERLPAAALPIRRRMMDSLAVLTGRSDMGHPGGTPEAIEAATARWLAHAASLAGRAAAAAGARPRATTTMPGEAARRQAHVRPAMRPSR
jgi:hypothetical protein